MFENIDVLRLTLNYVWTYFALKLTVSYVLKHSNT